MIDFQFEPPNPRPPDTEEMKLYVQSKCKYKLTDEQFDKIEGAFREKWNSSTGKFVGDGVFKSYVFGRLEKDDEFFMLEMIEDNVDLIIEYMEDIEQYWNYTTEN